MKSKTTKNTKQAEH